MLATANKGKFGRAFGKNAGEWTRRVEISKEEILGSKRSIYGYIRTCSRYYNIIINLRFADEINGLAGVEEELLNKATTAYGKGRDQSREDKVDDNQQQWYQQRDQSKWTESSNNHKLQVPELNCI